MAVEPHVTELPKELKGKPVDLVDTETALGADLIVMLVNHAPFRAIPPSRVTGKLLVDTRGVWTRAAP